MQLKKHYSNARKIIYSIQIFRFDTFIENKRHSVQQDEPKLEIIDSVENEINLEEELASPQSMMTLPQAEKISLTFSP